MSLFRFLLSRGKNLKGGKRCRSLATRRRRKMAQSLAQRLKEARRERLNEFVYFEILSRLSAKSICSYRTVCKSWNGLARGKYFAKKQLAYSRENPSFISCPDTNAMRFYSINPGSLELASLNRIVPSEKFHAGCLYMISSFNGLICGINPISEEYVEKGFSDMEIWICNPCTGETLLLPQGTPSYDVEPSVGVAYDSDTSDYKVFRIFSTGTKIPQEMSYTEAYYQEGQRYTVDHYALTYACEVYSSSTCSWRNIGAVPCAPMEACLSPFRSSHVFARGKLYWLVSLNDRGKILSVDMQGRFDVLKLPRYKENLPEEDAITGATFLVNLYGSLSVVILHPYCMDVWVWRKTRGKYRWTEVCVARHPIIDEHYGDVWAVASLKNKIVCLSDRHWWCYDLKDKTWERKRGPPSRFVNPSIFPFTGSFLSCNGGEML